MDATRTEEWGYRTGGVAALCGGFGRLAIVAAYAATGLGAAGDRSYGSFSGLTFIPSLALVVAIAGMHRAFASELGRIGRFSLALSGLGLTLVAIGQMGGEWLSFPRSGNFLIGPGAILMMVGLVAFAMSAMGTSVRRLYSALALSIGLLPLVFLPLAAGLEVWSGDTFPPSMDDNYFRAMNAFEAVLWMGLGTALARGASNRSVQGTR